MFRYALLCCVAVGLAGCGGKPNKDKIVGDWVITKSSPESIEGTYEFTQDGKVLMKGKITKTGLEIKSKGTYSVEGDKLKTLSDVSKSLGEEPEVKTIIKLTETEMVLESKAKEIIELRRK